MFSAFGGPSAFGAPATPAAPATGLFGTPAPAAPASSIFGAPAAPAASAFPAPSGFAGLGAPASFGGLGAFGATAPPSATFGASAPGLLFAAAGTSAAGATSADQLMTPAQSEQAIEMAYNPAPQNRYYRFRYIFYNVLPANTNPEQIKMPANFDPALWEQARRDNPDPRRFVPVQANGFSELKVRVDEQDKMVAQQTKALEEMHKFVRAVEQRQEVKLEDARRRHQELQLRLMRVLRKAEVLQAKGAGLLPEEERWKAKVQSMQREINSPTQYKGRLNELVSLAKLQDDGAMSQELLAAQVLDEASLETTDKFLAEQQTGLFELTAILKKDTRDLSAIADNVPQAPPT